MARVRVGSGGDERVGVVNGDLPGEEAAEGMVTPDARTAPDNAECKAKQGERIETQIQWPFEERGEEGGEG